MADVTQSVIAGSFRRALTSGIPEDVREFTGEPSALLIHTQDALALTDVGVGDENRLRLTLPLPKNFAYILRRAVATIISTTSQSALWTGANLELYSTNNEGVPAGASTLIKWPMGGYIIPDFSSSPDRKTFAMMAGENSPTLTADDNVGGAVFQSTPGMILYGGKTDPVFEVYNLTASSSDYVISFLFEWFQYYIPQANHTGLYWSIPVRS